jgi:hypothetical protein
MPLRSICLAMGILAILSDFMVGYGTIFGGTVLALPLN